MSEFVKKIIRLGLVLFQFFELVRCNIDTLSISRPFLFIFETKDYVLPAPINVRIGELAGT